jgi:glycine cleavage system H protein
MAGDFPDDLRYTESDEWVKRDGDTITAGITAFASEQLGDVVYLQLPEIGRHVVKGDAFGEIESVKAVSDLYAPLTGEVTAVNEELDQNPGLVNDDPYGNGWIARMRLTDPGQFDSLLDAAAYEKSTTERH